MKRFLIRTAGFRSPFCGVVVSVLIGTLAIPLLALGDDGGLPWPSRWNSVGPCAEEEPAGDKSPTRVDLVGGAGQAAAFWAVEQGYVFFRERVAQEPSGPGGFAQFVWAVLLQTPEGDPHQYQWLISLNGKRDTVELWQNTRGSPIRFDPIFRDAAEVRVASLPAAQYARLVPAGTVFGGQGNFFVDWAFPIQCRGESSGDSSGSGGCLESVGVDPHTAAFWFVTSANANNFNKDWLNCPFSPGTELAITKSVAPSVIPAGTGSAVEYTVTVRNGGVRRANGIQVWDSDLPGWITPNSVSSSAGSANLVAGGFEASLASLEPGASLTIRLLATASPLAASSFVNRALAFAVNAAQVDATAQLEAIAETLTPSPIATPTPTGQSGSVSPTALTTAIQLPTRTPTATATIPSSPSATPTASSTNTQTSTATQTSTPTPTATRTSTPLPSATPTPTTLCGNGDLDPGESCDDGNNVDGDCCTGDCRAEPPGATCDDGLACTVGDVCDGFGVCRSEPSTGQYAILRWSSAEPLGSFTTVLGQRSLVLGHVCTDIVRANGRARVLGDLVGLMTSGNAIVFGKRTQVTGAVVTGGGFVAGLDKALVGEFKGADSQGETPEMVQCADARQQTAALRGEVLSAASDPQNRFGAVVIKARKMLRLPVSGTFGAGSVVLDFDDLKISSSGKLILAAGPETEEIVLRVANRFRAARRAKIELEGLQANQVVLLVQGPVTIGGSAIVRGTLIGSDRIVMRRRALLEGGLFGRTLLLSGSARVQRAPWVGWCR